MSEDRSQSSNAVHEPPKSDSERWYERLLAGLGLRGSPSIRDDLEDALADGVPTGDFSPKERAMLKNVLGLRELRVEDAMVPRADIVAVPVETTLGNVLSVFRTAGHSRLPVYGETLDDPRGMVHIRDFVDFLAARAEDGLKPRGGRRSRAPSLGGIDLSLPLVQARILRPVLFVPPSMPALDLLVKMQATRTHMALVIDEYGGTDGLVSMEDVVEMVVGDIEDEHDADEGAMIAASDNGTFVADARASLEEVSQAISVDLAHVDDAEEIDTIGGLIVTLAGRVPARGELITGPGDLEFEVLDADPRRLKRLRIHRRSKDESQPRRRAARRDDGEADKPAPAPPPAPVEAAGEPPQPSPPKASPDPAT
jgi:CBS domain containing-hemolysin-like protein